MFFSLRADGRALRRLSAALVVAMALGAGACGDDGASSGGSGVANGGGGAAGAGGGGALAGDGPARAGEGPASAGEGTASAGKGTASPGDPEPPGEAGANTGGGGGGSPAPGSGAQGGEDPVSNAGGGGSGGEDPPEEELGLPCGVRKILRARCQSCHSKTPVPGTDVQLMRYSDLATLSKVVPTVTVAARVLHRMRAALDPMPPAPAGQATSEEVATLQAWMDSGMVAAACDEAPDPYANPYDAPPTCSSGSFWPGNFNGATWMMPGAACLSCHRQYIASAPMFTVAGTVFATAHEPDKCYGVPVEVGAKIVITDANDVERVLPVAGRGNFGDFLTGLVLPYRAKVVVGDKERVMLTPQTNGDCNACHSQFGAQGALGRIILP